jgi:hypothetical protein
VSSWAIPCPSAWAAPRNVASMAVLCRCRVRGPGQRRNFMVQ